MNESNSEAALDLLTPQPTRRPVCGSAWTPTEMSPGGSTAHQESDAPPVGSVLAGRYLVQGHVGEGGMGTVLRVFDQRLQRELALKIAKVEPGHDGDLVHRFLDEAHVCGRLQHPGVVPLHEIDYLPDGRPFFTMKLVQGRTLAELLRDTAGSRNREGALPASEVSRFVKVFEQACQAIAYAHSQGVIHRDLKPSNVMVGAFGEVQVMDWGIAKDVRSMWLPEDGPAIEAIDAVGIASIDGAVRVQSSSGPPTGSWTRAGRVMGTLAYMPPEQARAEPGRVGPRADVFALGAMLCEVLTGLPPYSGIRSRLWQQAAGAELGPARERLARAGADPELTAIVRTCLDPDPDRRPADADAVAALVAGYRAGVERRLQEAQEERTAAEARAEAEVLARTEAEARARAEQARGVAERRRRHATAALTGTLLVIVMLGGGAAWYLQRQDDAARQKQREDDERVGRLLDSAGQEWPAARERNDVPRLRELATVYRKADDLARSTAPGEGQRKRAASERARADRELDHAEKLQALLAGLLYASTPLEEWHSYETDGRRSGYHLPQFTPDQLYSAAFRRWGLDLDRAPIEESVAALRAEPQSIVAALVPALDDWALDRRQRGRPDPEWRRLAELAGRLDRGDKLRQDLRRWLLGGDLVLERAIGELRTALLPLTPLAGDTYGTRRKELRAMADGKRLAQETPLGIVYLSRALTMSDDTDLAERVLRSAVLTRDKEPVLWAALGMLLESAQPPRFKDATACYLTARGMRPEFGTMLARVLAKDGKLEEATDVLQDLIHREPDNPAHYYSLGMALRERRLYAEAESAFRTLRVRRPDLPLAPLALSVVLLEQGPGRFGEADIALRDALLLRPQFPQAQHNRGVLLFSLGRFEDAEAAYREAIRMEPDFPQAHANLGNVLLRQQRLPEAQAAYDEALRLKPNFPSALLGRGAVLLEQGHFPEAEAACLEVIRVAPRLPEGHMNLGNALRQQGKLVDAEKSYREAILLRRESETAHFLLGLALADQRKFREAERAFQEALRLKPDFSDAKNELNRLLRLRQVSAESGLVQ